MAQRLKAVVWAGVAAALIGFFLPWAMLDLKTTDAERHIASGARRGLSQAFTPHHAEAPPSKTGRNRALFPKGKTPTPRLWSRGTGFTSVKRGTKATARKSSRGMPLIPTRVSGYQIPRLANRENVRVIMGLTELVTKKRERIGLKSYAVYLAPGLALLCGLLLTARVGATRPAAAGVALVCGAVAVAGCWTLLTTDTRARYAVAIGPGLWLSLAAYAVLALAAAAQVLPEPFQGRVRRLLPG